MQEKISALNLVFTFDTTTQAMAMERFCREHNFPGKLIPIPNQLSAGCGLAWKTMPEQKETILTQMKAEGIGWADCHLIQL